MLGSSDIIAFGWSTNLVRARAFYERALGLRCLKQDEFACVFDANGTMLRVTAVPEVAKASYTVLGWRVDSMEETIQALAANGVVFTRYDGMDQDVNGVWTTPGGDKVAWFTDPDGNNLSVTQFLQGPGHD
jgi:catechol 2,3-dioxygenase-like lactoylglutathione lyase family enzyme